MNRTGNVDPSSAALGSVAPGSTDWTSLESAVKKVSVAVRKLAMAASSRLGRDCYAHAELGQALLKDLGFETQPVLGYSAWRVGSQSGAVLSHTPCAQSSSTRGIAYHAWLEWRDVLVDFTTYQFRLKMEQLDALDGGQTQVSWCPEYLILPKRRVRSFRDVRQAPDAGVAYYEARSELFDVLEPQALDSFILPIARTILANPGLHVMGPNDLPQDSRADPEDLLNDSDE